MTRCWILLGMMGAGKSSVGRALAELSGREFLDTDLLLQQRLGRPIPQIFQIYGEEAFRDHETSVLRSLQPAECVLSTGGGIVTREENWPELRRLGITVFLQAETQSLLQHLRSSKKKRPLLQCEDWEERVLALMAQRQHLYERADIIMQLSEEDVISAAQRVLETIQEHERNHGKA